MLKLIILILTVSAIAAQLDERNGGKTLLDDLLLGVDDDGMASDIDVATGPRKGGGTFSAADVNTIVDCVNQYRCKHGAKALRWDNTLAADTHKHFGTATSMHHSQSYKLTPAQGGPSGENLAWGWRSNGPGMTAKKACDAWYSEIKDCGDAHCQNGNTGVTGHFTAMVWKSVSVMACTRSVSKTVVACRFGNGPSGSIMDVPNMNMHSNLPKMVDVKYSGPSPPGCNGVPAAPLPAAAPAKAPAKASVGRRRRASSWSPPKSFKSPPKSSWGAPMKSPKTWGAPMKSPTSWGAPMKSPKWGPAHGGEEEGGEEEEGDEEGGDEEGGEEEGGADEGWGGVDDV